ncbi:MAG: hypothetical protein JNK87_12255 [Bryobacterales bacterium]|nr:hypothetical protein [Bryobacterales bacterium]
MQRRFGLDCINYLGDASTVAKPPQDEAVVAQSVNRAELEQQAIEELIREKEKELSRLTKSLRRIKASGAKHKQ